jgi:hypothetical protein
MFLALDASADILPEIPLFTVKRVSCEGMVMISSGVAELDFIEELRLRRWARENYVPSGRRQNNWHPIVHEEMEKKDLESGPRIPQAVYASSAR